MNPKEAQQYINQLETAYTQEQAKSAQLQQGANSIFQGQRDNNLIEFQLEMDSILERMDHNLRGHVIKFDEKGNQVWSEPEDTRNIIFSELGTQEILRFISQYLNRNLILSSYDQEVIYKRLNVIGNELSDIIYCKSEDMFYRTPIEVFAKELGYKEGEEVSEIDYIKIIELREEELKEKEKNYPITVLPIIHAIESAYNRALGGEERKTLRQNIMVTQNNPNQQQVPMMPIQKSHLGGKLNPMNWGM